MSTANQEARDNRKAKVIEKKIIEGKSLREVGKELGVCKDTVAADLKEIRQDPTLKDMLKVLIHQSMKNAVSASLVEDNFMFQVSGKDQLTTQEADTASKIGNINQKRYSMLKGDVTDDDGGLKEVIIKLPEDV